MRRVARGRAPGDDSGCYGGLCHGLGAVEPHWRVGSRLGSPFVRGHGPDGGGHGNLQLAPVPAAAAGVATWPAYDGCLKTPRTSPPAVELSPCAGRPTRSGTPADPVDMPNCGRWSEVGTFRTGTGLRSPSFPSCWPIPSPDRRIRSLSTLVAPARSGRPPPDGFRRDETKLLEPDPDRLDIVGRAIGLSAAGHMDAHGSGRSRAALFTLRGKLTSPLHVGRLRDGGAAHWPPLVDAATGELVQATQCDTTSRPYCPPSSESADGRGERSRTSVSHHSDRSSSFHRRGAPCDRVKPREGRRRHRGTTGRLTARARVGERDHSPVQRWPNRPTWPI